MFWPFRKRPHWDPKAALQAWDREKIGRSAIDRNLTPAFAEVVAEQLLRRPLEARILGLKRHRSETLSSSRKEALL
jgi:hypothetical protein